LLILYFVACTAAKEPEGDSEDDRVSSAPMPRLEIETDVNNKISKIQTTNIYKYTVYNNNNYMFLIDGKKQKK
jgi:hypothetical protein